MTKAILLILLILVALGVIGYRYSQKGSEDEAGLNPRAMYLPIDQSTLNRLFSYYYSPNNENETSEIELEVIQNPLGRLWGQSD